MDKSADAFRTISEVAAELDLPQHVLRFWETRFPQIRPMKRAGGRRFYRPGDVEILRAIRRLLYSEGYTIRGVQRILKERGARAVAAMGEGPASEPADDGAMMTLAEAGEPYDVEAPAEGRPQPGDLFSPTPALALPLEAVERLRAAARDLEECERMLAAARRGA